MLIILAAQETSLCLQPTAPCVPVLGVGLSYFTPRFNIWKLLAGRQEGVKAEVINKTTQCKMLRSSLKEKAKLKQQH